MGANLIQSIELLTSQYFSKILFFKVVEDLFQKLDFFSEIPVCLSWRLICKTRILSLAKFHFQLLDFFLSLWNFTQQLAFCFLLLWSFFLLLFRHFDLFNFLHLQLRFYCLLNFLLLQLRLFCLFNIFVLPFLILLERLYIDVP